MPKLRHILVGAFLFIMPLLGPARAANAPVAPTESEAQCSLLFRHFDRALPKSDGRFGALVEGRTTLVQLSDLVKQDRKHLDPAHAGRPRAVSPLADGGHTIRFHTGRTVGEPGGADAEDYRILSTRLARLLDLAESHPDQVSLYYTDDLGQIRDLLETKQRRRDRLEERQRRAQSCFWIGFPFGALALGFAGFESGAHEKREMVEKVKRSSPIAGTRATHLSLLAPWLAGDPEGAQKLEGHLQYLELRKRKGLPIPYGARPSDYDEAGRKSAGISLEQMNDLALQEPVNLGTLDQEVAEHQPHFFSQQDIVEADSVNWGAPAMAALTGALGGGLAGLGAYNLCRHPSWLRFTAEARFQVGRVTALGGPRELKPFRDLLRQSLKPQSTPVGSPVREVLWQGANTLEGDHRDVFLIVDKKSTPPQLELLGFSYKAPTDYLMPPISKPGPLPSSPEPKAPPSVIPPPKTVPTPTVDLTAMEHTLRAKYFAGQPAKNARSVTSLFEEARALALSPEELAIFLAAARQYHSEEDARLMRYALDKIRRDRNPK